MSAQQQGPEEAPELPWPNHPHQPPTRCERLVMAIIDHVPRALLTDAYEFVVSLALAGISIAVVIGPVEPHSIHAAVGPAFRLTWAITLMIGSSITVAGLLGGRPRMEWCGQITMGVDLALYGLATLTVNAQQAGVAGVIFLALGVLGVWRATKISYTRYVQARLARDMAQALVNRSHREAGTHA